MPKGAETELMDKWKVQDAVEMYGVRLWGKGYFGVNKAGHVTVHPNKRADQSVDLKEVIDQLQARGIQLPILLRFTDILRHRVGEIHDAFQKAIMEYEYGGGYCCVYPIKVNQQRHVVEEILDFGKAYRFGLEAGSKPELLAVLALTNGLDTPIICNGFKDDEFIRMTMLARKIGKPIIPVVEKFTELELILRHAEDLRVRPSIGVRVKLAAPGPAAGARARLPFQVRPDPDRGAGRRRVPQAARHGRLPGAGPLPPRQPDHQHSEHQACADRGDARLRRAAPRRGRRQVPRRGRRPRHRLRRLADRLRVVDQLHLPGYANDVVFRVKSVCDEAGVPHPTILSESGRAVVAYHSLLVFDVLGVSNFDQFDARRRSRPTPRSRSPTCSPSTAT